MAANLPPEIITEILTRLCVKDLLRYRSVAKPWCSMIDGPDFIKKQLHYALKTASRLGVVIKERDLHWMRLDSPDDVSDKLHHPIEVERGWTELIGSCNGLLALCNSFEDVAIWNPSTRKYRKLPSSAIEYAPEELIWIEFLLFGFGYDRVSDDYKLVRLVQFSPLNCASFESEVKVYSAKNNSWKRIQDFPYHLCNKHGNGVLVNGALHWIVTRTKSDEMMFIVAFDLEREEYFEVPMPNFEEPKIDFSIDVFEGSLCVVYNFLNDDHDADRESLSKGVEIWVMKEHGVKESWIKLFSVLPNEQIRQFSYILAVANLRDDRILLDMNGKKFITFDLKGGKAEDADFYSCFYMEWKVCAESLVGLDSPEGNAGWKTRVESKKKKTTEKEKQNRDDFLSHGFKLVL